MTQSQKAWSVLNYLSDLGVKAIAIARSTCDENLEKSYQLITENPNIGKMEFLRIMQISEK